MVAKTRPRVTGRRIIGDPHDRTFAQAFDNLTRHEAGLDTHHREVAAYREELTQRAHEVAHRFGLNWRDLSPKDLDILAYTAPVGDHWWWQGWTNNKACPVIRVRTRAQDPGRLNSDHSVNPILHRLFVPGHEPPAVMRQRCGAAFLCVRPEHRCTTCAEATS